jgi:hypothetical protein
LATSTRLATSGPARLARERSITTVFSGSVIKILRIVGEDCSRSDRLSGDAGVESGGELGTKLVMESTEIDVGVGIM